MDSNTKAVFVSAVKGIWKIFYTMGHVWIGWKIQSNEKWFPLTVKYQPLKCKIVYTSLLPSNQLHPFSAYLNRERERERERELEPEIWTLPPPPSRSNSRHLDLVIAWSLPLLNRSCHLNLITHDLSRRP